MATIRDVARHAGVSIATVSRVLSGRVPTRPETRARVAEAIAALGFRPNAIGRSLKAGTSRIIGVVAPTLANPVFAEMVEGLQRTAREAGYQVMVTTSDYAPATERSAAETLLVGRVDALVMTVADPADPSTQAWMTEIPCPLALVYNQPGARPTITVDNEAAGSEVAGLFLAKGHRRLAMVSGSQAASDRARARWQGFSGRVAAAGGPPPRLAEIAFDETDLLPTMAALMAARPPPTAVFCSNDLIALRAIAALRRLGLGVPANVSVAGFDGIPTGALVEPSLATIAQPSRAMGETAARLVLNELAGGVAEPVTILPHRLIEGASVAPPPLAARPSPSTIPTPEGVAST